MPKASAGSKTQATSLAAEISGFFADPLGFVLFAYPWGEAGTELEHETGPDEWQLEVLKRIGESILDDPQAVIREAVASGHGVGKSAFLCWIIQWVMSTRPHCKGVVTANTENQLDTKTWPELAKWHSLMMPQLRSWFEYTATQYKAVASPNTWFFSKVPWSENRPEAFAGTHGRDVVIMFDEASAIPEVIWDNAEGAMTTPGAMFFAFGNMTRAIGKFVQCFERLRHRWKTTHVDSRKAKKANKKQIEEWIQDYGEDSDFVRIRVRGVKPRAGTNQFIPYDTVYECHQYKAVDYHLAAKVASVDLARSGNCESVYGVRQGRKLHPQTKWRERNSMVLAGYIDEKLKRDRPQVCFIEGAGLGGPIIDRLRALGWGDVVIEVNPGARLPESERYFNNRSKWWGICKEWLEGGAELPEDPGPGGLDEQLTMAEYFFDPKTTQLKLVPKEEASYSPDRADQLVLTFCHGKVMTLAKDSLQMEEQPEMFCV